MTALAAEGIRHMPEAGRAIIRDQVAIGGTALPWTDRAAFADAERRQDFAEAEATHAVMIETWVGLGYEVMALPLAPVTERVRFVRDAIDGGQNG